PRLLTSFPPIHCFVKNVADEDAAVLCLLKTTGPHEYQPTVADLLLARRAEFLFINGLTIDDTIAENLKRHSGNPNLDIVNLGDPVETKIPFAHDKKAD